MLKTGRTDNLGPSTQEVVSVQEPRENGPDTHLHMQRYTHSQRCTEIHREAFGSLSFFFKLDHSTWTYVHLDSSDSKIPAGNLSESTGLAPINSFK